MDSNNPLNPPAPVATPPATPNPLSPNPTPAGVVPNPAPPVNPGAGTPLPAKGGHKKLLLIVGVLVLLLAAGGVYFYMQQNQPVPEPVPVTQAPEDSTIAALKKELDALAITEVEADFTAVDRDLESL